MIEWRDVPGYEGLYQVSDTGLILGLPKSTSSGKIIKPTINADGYLTVCLSKGNAKKTFRVNRLVALAFIPNPLYKLEVNHIDGDKANNTVSNLEWCDRSENEKHAYSAGLKERVPSAACMAASARAHMRRVRRSDGMTFESIRDAAAAVGANDKGASISKVCRGLRKSAHGFDWEYAELDAKTMGGAE